MTVSSRADVENAVINTVSETIRDWDIDQTDITMNTHLMRDLAFESIDIVQFAVAIEQAMDRKGLPFEKLFMKDGDFVDDVSLDQVTDFLCGELGVR